jgi:hypothetical protein
MVRFRFGNEQVSHARVPFPGGTTGHNLRCNSGWIPGWLRVAASQWR